MRNRRRRQHCPASSWQAAALAVTAKREHLLIKHHFLGRIFPFERYAFTFIQIRLEFY